MSKHGHPQEAVKKFTLPGNAPDGATPVGTMTLSGVVRTTRGYAVAIASLGEDGSMVVTLGNSQVYPEHIASEHKRVAVKATLAAQVQR